MLISTVWILKYVQQCYVKWFWTISSLGAPVRITNTFPIKPMAKNKMGKWERNRSRLPSMLETVVRVRLSQQNFEFKMSPFRINCSVEHSISHKVVNSLLCHMYKINSSLCSACFLWCSAQVFTAWAGAGPKKGICQPFAAVCLMTRYSNHY